jgi:hypothetical protein
MRIVHLAALALVAAVVVLALTDITRDLSWIVGPIVASIVIAVYDRSAGNSWRRAARDIAVFLGLFMVALVPAIFIVVFVAYLL